MVYLIAAVLAPLMMPHRRSVSVNHYVARVVMPVTSAGALPTAIFVDTSCMASVGALVAATMLGPLSALVVLMVNRAWMVLWPCAIVKS